MGDSDDRQSSTATSGGKLWDSSPESELAAGSGEIRSVQRTLIGVQAAIPGEPIPGSLAAEAQQFVTEQRVSEPPPPPPGLRFIPTRYRTIPPAAPSVRPGNAPRAAAWPSPQPTTAETPEASAPAAAVSAAQSTTPARTLQTTYPATPPDNPTSAASALTPELTGDGDSTLAPELTGDSASAPELTDHLASAPELTGDSASATEDSASGPKLTGDSALTPELTGEVIAEPEAASALAAPDEGAVVAAEPPPAEERGAVLPPAASSATRPLQVNVPFAPAVSAATAASVSHTLHASTSATERPQVIRIGTLDYPKEQQGSRKWIGALLAAGVIGGVALVSSRTEEKLEPAAPAATATAAAVKSPVPTPEASAPAPEPVIEKPALPPLALRPAQTLKTCDKLLGRPFAERSKPNRAMAKSGWRQALKSLMTGKTEQAQKLMCYSATWDLGGPATYGLAEFLMKAGDYPQAFKFAALVPAKDENELRKAHELVGDIHAQLGELEPARESWLKLFDTDPKDKAAVAEIAARYVKSGKAALAKSSRWTTELIFRRAAILDPDNADAAAGLARALRKQDLDDAAFEWIQYAVKKNSESGFAQLELLEQLVARKEYEAAKEVLKVARRLAPKRRRITVLERRIAKE